MSERADSRKATRREPRVGVAKGSGISGSPDEFDDASLDEVMTLVADAVSRALSLTDLVGGKEVFVKPNLVRPNLPNCPAVITDPRVILAVALLARKAGAAHILVGDNPGYGVASRDALRSSKVEALLAEHDLEACYLDEEPMVACESPTALLLRRTLLPEAIVDCDVLINVPKMKTHVQTMVSLGIKNLHGLVPDGERLPFHRQDVHQKLVDILSYRRPDLTVVDGIWAVEGQAPLFGSALEGFNVIVAGQDVVAVDAVTAAVMGIAPEEVPMIQIAGARGLGAVRLEEIEIVGPRIEDVRRHFRRAIISSAGHFPTVTCIEGGACSGCLSNLRHSLDKLHRDGSLGEPCPITVYVGVPLPGADPMETWEGDLWLFGDCSAALPLAPRAGPGAVRRVPGCPPHILDFAKLFEATYLGRANGGPG